MISPHDFYYKKLETEEVSTEKLHEIYSYIEKAQPGMNSKYDFFDVFTKMSENKNCNDDLIKKMFGFAIRSSMYHEKAYLLLDKGSKALFDDLWQNGPYEYTEKIWQSKHADEKQLAAVYKEQLVGKVLPSNKSNHTKASRMFLMHPNAPDFILSKIASVDSDLITIASNPNIVSKPKAFKHVSMKVRQHSYFDGNMDDILKAFLNNPGLTWDELAEAIDLDSQLKTVLNVDISVIKKTSDKRVNLILDFCRRRECPDNIRAYLYERTKDDDFLPQVAKDIFMF